MTAIMTDQVLVRYGAMSEVARFRVDTRERLKRGQRVVVRTHRGLEVGSVLQDVDVKDVGANHVSGNGQGGALEQDDSSANCVLRPAGIDDERQAAHLRRECEQQFAAWTERIQSWNLELELVDLEWTLDRRKLVLYVLNSRGPDCTKLALQAAAAGLGIIEVQPVGSDGLVMPDLGGGCGSGGCGCNT